MPRLTTEEFLIFLNRNPNALLAKRHYQPGERLDPGLYWNVTAQKIEAFPEPTTARGVYVKLHDDTEASFADVFRTFALGGGGPSGRALPPDFATARREAAHA